MKDAQKGHWLTLLAHCERDGSCSVSQVRLAGSGGCKVETFAAFIAGEEKAKRISREHRAGKADLLRVNMAAVLLLDARKGRRDDSEPTPEKGEVPTPAEGYPRTEVPPERGTPAEGVDLPPQRGTTTHPGGVGPRHIGTRACPSSGPFPDLSGGGETEPFAHAHEGSTTTSATTRGRLDHFTGKTTQGPWVHPDETVDTDALERKAESLRNLWHEKTGFAPHRGAQDAIERWAAKGPLELVRYAIKRMAEKVHEEHVEPARAATSSDFRTGLVQSIIAHAKPHEWQPQAARPGDSASPPPKPTAPAILEDPDPFKAFMAERQQGTAS